jgi:hypothetical protein
MLKILVFVTTCTAALVAQVPEIRSVQPEHGQIGAVLQANGIHLEKGQVDSLYLTDEKMDLMVKVLGQTENSIQFRIPPSVKPGRLRLLLKLAGENSPMLELPIFVRVDEGSAKAPLVAEAKQ